MCAAALVVAFGSCSRVAVAQDGTRVLQRDPNAGGPAGVALDTLGPLFESEALNDALRALDGGRPDAAIEELSAWLAGAPGDPRVDEATFALGYALYEAERWSEAAPVLAECARVAPLFADYCQYWAADVALRSGDPAGAEAFAATVAPDAVFGPRARYLRGKALAELGRHDEAVVVFERFLSEYPSAWYRTDVEFALGASYEAVDDADDAALLYHRVALVNPNSSAETRAREALEALGDRVSRAVAARIAEGSNAEVLERARVLFGRHRSEDVIELLEPVVASEAPGTALYCEAAYLVGKSYSKLRQHRDSVGPYEAVIAACDDRELVVKALYNAGRGAWNIDEDAAAIAHFRRLWTEYADHSYADDAILLAARVHRNNDNEDAYVGLLEEQMSLFPEGDMLKDAVWLLASRLYSAGDFRGTVQFVDRIGSRTGENDLYSRGRLAYFRARSLERLSLVNEAVGAYVSVARDNPMSYYALLSLNRLRDIDPDRARDAVSELAATGTGSEGTIEVRPAEAATNPHFLRGRTLLRMGLYELVESEFGRLRDAFANEDEIGWVVSLMYHHAGAYERSHHVPGDRQDLNLGYPGPHNLERWQVAYPTPFEDTVSAEAAERELDPYWVYAIMREESGFRPEIESWANARGLLQLMHGTANDMAALTGRGSVSTRQLFDPEVNIELGVMFMRTLSDRFGAHPCLVFAGYNGGHGNVNSWLRARGQMPLDEWVEEIPYAQTRHYVKRVTMTWWVYHWLAGDRLPDLTWDLSGL